MLIPGSKSTLKLHRLFIVGGRGDNGEGGHVASSEVTVDAAAGEHADSFEVSIPIALWAGPHAGPSPSPLSLTSGSRGGLAAPVLG